MKTWHPISIFCLFFYLLFLVVVGARLLVVHQADLELSGLPIWLEIFSLLILYGYINLSSLGLGKKIVWLLPKSVLTTTEFNLLSYLVGFGLLAIGIFFLGMFNLMNSFAVFIYLVVGGLLTLSEWPHIVEALFNSIKSFHKPTPASSYEVLYLVFGGCILILLIIISLTPIWDYDALMYHLEIPRQYLQHGRIYFDPSNSRSSYPLLVEMFFILGIMLHLDALARLISVTYALIFIWSTYALGVRFFTRTIALLAVGILVGTPSFPSWASWASIDFAWSSYELWGIFALLIWLIHKTDQDNKWLVLGGAMFGLAASTKFLALPNILLSSLIIFWKIPPISLQAFFKLIKQFAIFGISVSVVMAPWYVRNWIWTGNPFYPVLFEGSRFQFLFYYMQSFGVGKGVTELLLLPLNMYKFQGYFSTVSWEIIHPALWLAFGFVFLTRWKKYRFLAVYSLLYFCTWALNGQLIRLLTPVTAIAALLSASMIDAFPGIIKKWFSALFLGAFLCVSLGYQIWELKEDNLLGYFTGHTSASDILEQKVEDYRMKKYIESNLSKTDRVQFLWDGRAYYCDMRCIADESQATAMLVSQGSPTPESLAHQLRGKGVTHIMLSRSDAIWFIGYHDPKGFHKSALDYFEHIFFPACAKQIYVDNRMELYAITCQ